MQVARGYAGLTIDELAVEVGAPAAELVAVDEGRRRLRPELAPAIALACGVPRWFLEDGFAGAGRECDLHRRLTALEATVARDGWA